MLQKTLREQAVAMGIVGEEERESARPPKESAPADLAAYRRRKRGVA
jgi:hypothetical protein